MDDRMVYERFRISDYGTLQELTAGCLTSTGGDALVPSGHLGEFTVGPSANNSQVQCTSKT